VRAVLRIFAIIPLLAACANRPSFHTEATLGRVVAVEANDGGPSGPVPVMIVVPGAPVLSSIPFRYTKDSSRYYNFTIRDATGRVIQTQSINQFPVGACVRLWHAANAVGPGPEGKYNFISGTLEESKECGT
jgi:hypothetical protein